MPQRQHVISEWHLKRFATAERRGLVLVAFNKRTGALEPHVPSRFLAFVDDHSDEIEIALGRIKGPAAAAASRLVDRATRLPSGICLLEGEEDPPEVGPELGPVSPPIEGMRLIPGSRRIASPSEADRVALARYLALIYSRAPRMEMALRRISDAYRDGVAHALGSLSRPITPQVEAELRSPWLRANRRTRRLS